jgi:hypothetical protein
MAIAATSPQNEITDHRDVVVPTNRVIAAKAVRAGKDDRLSLRQAGDADIQEASKAKAKQPNDDINGCHVNPLQVSGAKRVRNRKFEIHPFQLDC